MLAREKVIVVFTGTLLQVLEIKYETLQIRHFLLYWLDLIASSPVQMKMHYRLGVSCCFHYMGVPDSPRIHFKEGRYTLQIVISRTRKDLDYETDSYL